MRSGKVRYIGTSTFAAWQVIESLWVSKEYGLNRFVTEQPPYNLLDRRIERELIPAAQTYGIGLIPWSPLAGGFLSGKYKQEGTQPAGRFSDRTHVRAAALLDNPRAFETVQKLYAVAADKGVPVAQLALAWTLSSRASPARSSVRGRESTWPTTWPLSSYASAARISRASTPSVHRAT